MSIYTGNMLMLEGKRKLILSLSSKSLVNTILIIRK